MTTADSDDWRTIATAPRDGSQILVAVRASEQGPAEVDVVCWSRAERAEENGWVATDSRPGLSLIYAEAELTGWMPLPTPMPPLHTLRARLSAASGTNDGGEMDGSSI